MDEPTTELEVMEIVALAVSLAMNALDLYQGESSAADEAFNNLDNALVVLNERLPKLRGRAHNKEV